MVTVEAAPLKQAVQVPAERNTGVQPGYGTKEKILNIPPADLWSVQKILHDKKGSLRRMLDSATSIRRQCKLRIPGSRALRFFKFRMRT